MHLYFGLGRNSLHYWHSVTPLQSELQPTFQAKVSLQINLLLQSVLSRCYFGRKIKGAEWILRAKAVETFLE
jgi:hypothetical protein